MKPTNDINLDLGAELGWLLATIEAARLLAEMAEGNPENATQLATNTHAVLRGAITELQRLITKLDTIDASPRRRRQT